MKCELLINAKCERVRVFVYFTYDPIGNVIANHFFISPISRLFVVAFLCEQIKKIETQGNDLNAIGIVVVDCSRRARAFKWKMILHRAATGRSCSGCCIGTPVAFFGRWEKLHKIAFARRAKFFKFNCTFICRGVATVWLLTERKEKLCFDRSVPI